MDNFDRLKDLFGDTISEERRFVIEEIFVNILPNKEIDLPFNIDYLKRIHSIIFKIFYPKWAGIDKFSYLISKNDDFDNSGYYENICCIFDRLSKYPWLKLNQQDKVKHIILFIITLYNAKIFYDGNNLAILEFFIRFAKSIGLIFDRKILFYMSKEIKKYLIDIFKSSEYYNLDKNNCFIRPYHQNLEFNNLFDIFYEALINKEHLKVINIVSKITNKGNNIIKFPSKNKFSKKIHKKKKDKDKKE